MTLMMITSTMDMITTRPVDMPPAPWYLPRAQGAGEGGGHLIPRRGDWATHIRDCRLLRAKTRPSMEVATAAAAAAAAGGVVEEDEDRLQRQRGPLELLTRILVI